MIPLAYILTQLPGDPVDTIATATPHVADAQKMLPITPHPSESTYFIARVLMEFCHWLTRLFGQPYNTDLFLWLYVIVVFLFSMCVGILLKWFVVWLLHKISPHIKSDIYIHLVQEQFFMKTCNILPPVIFLILIQFTLYTHNSIASWLTRLSVIYIVVVMALALCTLCDVIWKTIDERENKRKLPLRGIVQIAKLLIWMVAVILIAALLFDKSPAALLAGLGAFAAVLMLIFKDSILGIVAGVQLAQNDSLHVGDWISIPNGNANGIVQGVSLTEVKVQNWDKTVSTVPPYTLITGGFKNYRSMQVSNTREINRSYLIDADSVVETSAEMLESFKTVPMMKDWIEKKQAQQQSGKVQNVNNSEGLADGTIDTNLGVFRAYLKMWLDANPEISHSDDCFVATMAQTPNGIPLWIYCFTATSGWAAYEAIMSSVFEHLAVMLHRFNLYTYEEPSGRDTLIDGYLSPGKTSSPIFGLPYPFYNDSGTPANPGIPPVESTPQRLKTNDDK